MAPPLMAVVFPLARGLARVYAGLRTHTLLVDTHRVQLRRIHSVSSQARTHFCWSVFTRDLKNKVKANPIYVKKHPEARRETSSTGNHVLVKSQEKNSLCKV